MTRHSEQVFVCLTIGGSDSCAGAGIQADLGVFQAFGIRGCSVITALTAQNPELLLRIEPAPIMQIEAEMGVIFDYYDVQAVKTGMLVDAERVHCVASRLQRHLAHQPLIVDPVMTATSGKPLLDQTAIETLKDEILPQAALITPNLDEAAVFLGRPVDDVVEDAAALMLEFGCAILLKGGHGEGDELVDVLCDANGEVTPFIHARQGWSAERAHGTGCRLASAIAAGLAGNMPLAAAVSRGIEWLQIHVRGG